VTPGGPAVFTRKTSRPKGTGVVEACYLGTGERWTPSGSGRWPSRLLVPRPLRFHDAARRRLSIVPSCDGVRHIIPSDFRYHARRIVDRYRDR
jgi:hypothetical protein